MKAPFLKFAAALCIGLASLGGWPLAADEKSCDGEAEICVEQTNICNLTRQRILRRCVAIVMHNSIVRRGSEQPTIHLLTISIVTDNL